MRSKFIAGLFFFTLVIGQLTAQERFRAGQPAWTVSPEIQMLLSSMESIDPTLPAPRLFPEPPYTTGRTNTLFWSNTETVGSLTAAGIAGTVLFYEVRAYSDSTGQLWGFVPAETDQATFTDLPSGIPIYYNLRYYFRFSSGEYGLSYWNSDSTHSIQDLSRPIFSRFDIVGLNTSGQKNWVTEPTIELNIQAYDPDNGQVAQVKIREFSGSYEDSILYDFGIPETEVDTNIPYELNSNEHEQIDLVLNVIDVAGQHSETLTISLFWWHLVEMVCFPNPFNPDLGEVSTIETGDLDVDEARIFDLFGNLVVKLEKQKSSTFFQWDGRNSDGKLVSNGGYFCVINTDEKQYCKIAVLR